MEHSKKYAAAAFAIALVGLGCWQLARQFGTDRPRYIFVNETDHHDHDMAFRMSLKLAEQGSGVENALVLLKQLPPDTRLEAYAAQFFESHKIGRDRGGKGILYVYAERENEFRIEVSYSLESRFPDVLCHRLEEAARTYMLSEMPQDFISELIITMNIQKPDELGSTPGVNAILMSGGGGIKAHGYRRTVEDYQSAIHGLATKALAAYAPSRDAAETLRRYLASLERGLGEPQLPLLTEGSQLFRAIVPRNAAQQRRVFSSFESAGPYQLLLKGELGLALPKQGHSNLPVVLRHGSNGLWYVDEPKAWTYFHRFENNPDFWVKYADNPFAAEIRQAGAGKATEPIYTKQVPTPAPLPYPSGLALRLKELEALTLQQPGQAQNYATAGDLYLFEMDWVGRAIEKFEAAAKLAPDEPLYHWRLADLYLNNSEPEKMLGQFRWLARRFPTDKRLATQYGFFEKAYQFKAGDF